MAGVRAVEQREAEARRRVDESISGPLLRLWADWDRAWADLLGELIDGNGDGFRAAGAALVEVGRVVVRADEFRGRDLSELLAPKVPNLLANCPPLPAPGEVLVRLRAMASDAHFHTLTPPVAAGLIVAAVDGIAAGPLAEQLAEVAGSARLRDAFGWFGFIRDRLLPPPGPPVNGASTRIEAVPVVTNLDLHDLGRAEGLLPGRLGGTIEVEDEATEPADHTADAVPVSETGPEEPLVPWNPGVFAARIRALAGRLRVWHNDPFAPPIVALADGDPAVASKTRETFRDAIRLHVGRPEPVRPPADAGEASGDEPFAERTATLWLMGEVERQLRHVPPGVVWDYLRALVEQLVLLPAWAAVAPSEDTPPLSLLARQGRLVVAGRRVDETLLRGVEDAAKRLLLRSPDGGKQAKSAKAAVKRKRGRPTEDDDDARKKRNLYLGWKASGLKAGEYLHKIGRDDEEGRQDLDAGRKRVERERKKSGKKSSG